MVSFKTWKDNYLFIEEYCNYSCLNCYHNQTNRINEGSEDKAYAQILCDITLTFKRLDDEYPVCTDWVSKDGVTSFSQYIDESIWNLDDDAVDKIESLSGRISFDDVKKIVEEGQ